MLVRPQNALLSLKKIADVCHASSNTFNASVMGVIVDVTRPLFRERDKDYIVELKIVDETVNEVEVFGILVKYCSVYVFSKDREELELSNQIGQLLYITQFTFSLWNQIKLETKFRSTIEKLYTFQVDYGYIVPYRKLLSINQTDDDLMAQHLQARAYNLTKWFRSSYFYNKYKPALGISLVNNYCVMAQPFNMVVKLSNSKPEEVQVEKSMQNHIALEDSHQNIFLLNREFLPSKMPPGEYMLVRSVRYIGNFYQITLTETGYLLGLPLGFDANYKEDMNYCGISRFNERFLLRNHKTCNLSKINYVSPKVTPIAELLNQIELYENKQSQKDELRVEDLYMIEAVVVNFHGRIHLFHSEFQMIADEDYIASLTDDERTELIQKGTLEYLYQGTIGVIDRSSESTSKLLYVHLFTNEKRSRFFDSSVIDQLNSTAGMGKNHEEEAKVKAQIDRKLQSLIEKSDFTNTVSMLLEPIKSDVLLYRLTNTIFI